MELSKNHVPSCYRCRMYSYQYFIASGSRFFYLFELKNIRRPVSCAHDSFHSLGVIRERDWPLVSKGSSPVGPWPELPTVGGRVRVRVPLTMHLRMACC